MSAHMVRVNSGVECGSHRRWFGRRRWSDHPVKKKQAFVCGRTTTDYLRHLDRALFRMHPLPLQELHTFEKECGGDKHERVRVRDRVWVRLKVRVRVKG